MITPPDTPPRLPPSITQWFPLVPRPRPPASGLQERLAEINCLAYTPTAASTAIPAAEALNKAALLASDLGQPELAARLCWQQFRAFHHAGPLPPALATAALQPLVNLGRLAARARDYTHAYTIFDDLYNATRTRTVILLDGIQIDPVRLLNGEEAAHTASRFLWAVLLGDGTRALARAGRWDDALRHLHRHHGIGKRLLDGRQTLILARHHTDDTEGAHAALADSELSEPWERAVAALLHVLCLYADDPGAENLTAAVEAYETLDPSPAHILFYARLGLTLLDLNYGEIGQARVAARLTDAITRGTDGRAAADALSHIPLQARLTDSQLTAMSRIATAGGIGQPTPSPVLLEHLSGAARAAARSLDDTLRTIGNRTSPSAIRRT